MGITWEWNCYTCGWWFQTFFYFPSLAWDMRWLRRAISWLLDAGIHWLFNRVNLQLHKCILMHSIENLKKSVCVQGVFWRQVMISKCSCNTKRRHKSNATPHPISMGPVTGLKGRYRHGFRLSFSSQRKSMDSPGFEPNLTQNLLKTSLEDIIWYIMTYLYIYIASELSCFFRFLQF